MDQRTKLKLLSDSYDEPYKAIDEIISSGQLDDEVIDFVLGLDDHLVISDFLEKIEELPYQFRDTFRFFIEENIIDEDAIFVSDLIEFACVWRIDIMEDCLRIADNPENDSIVVMTCINYLFENLDFKYISEIFQIFEKVKDNVNYHQNSQVAVLFFLFRISHNDQYLEELKDLITNGQEMNKEVLLNILKWDYNQQRFFSYHDLLESICE